MQKIAIKKSRDFIYGDMWFYEEDNYHPKETVCIDYYHQGAFLAINKKSDVEEDIWLAVDAEKNLYKINGYIGKATLEPTGKLEDEKRMFSFLQYQAVLKFINNWFFKEIRNPEL